MMSIEGDYIPEEVEPAPPPETVFERLSIPLPDTVSSGPGEEDESGSVDAIFEATPESGDTDMVVIEDED